MFTRYSCFPEDWDQPFSDHQILILITIKVTSHNLCIIYCSIRFFETSNFMYLTQSSQYVFKQKSI